MLYKYFVVYNITARIYEKHGTTWRSWTDRIRVYKRKKSGNEVMRLFWAKRTTEKFDNSFFGLTKRGKPLIVLTKSGNKYTPGSVAFNSPVHINLTEEALDIDMFLSLEEENQQMMDVQSAIMRNLPMIMQFGGLMIIAFILIFVLDYSQGAMESANGMMTTIADKLASVVKIVGPGG